MTTQEYADRKQYFLKLQKYFEETDEIDALDRMREHAKKDKTPKAIIESDIEELSSKSADIVLSGEEQSEPEESDDSDTGYHKTGNKLPVPCSVCSRKRRLADALNCKNCSKCAQGDAAGLPPIGSSDEIDLENILIEASEKDIMPNEENNQQKELNQTETESDKKVNTENDFMEKTEDAKKDIKVTVNETETKLNLNGFDEKTKLQIKLTDIMRINKKTENGTKSENKSESSSSSGSSGSASESSSGSSQPPPPPPAKKRKLSKIGNLIKNLQPNRHGRCVCPIAKCYKDYGAKRAVHRHIKNNHLGNRRFYCKETFDDGTKCDADYPSKQLLDQHFHGIHGDGFVAYCGMSFTWPNDRSNHQQDCSDREIMWLGFRFRLSYEHNILLFNTCRHLSPLPVFSIRIIYCRSRKIVLVLNRYIHM